MHLVTLTYRQLSKGVTIIIKKIEKGLITYAVGIIKRETVFLFIYFYLRAKNKKQWLMSQYNCYF